MIKNTSETKTENLLRDFYGSKTFVEKSAIPTVYGFKSKKGTKYKGYPDFFLDRENYSIIVEAKAVAHKNAISEVEFYMDNNNIQKDIIGIAISGQTMKELKVSYFLKRQNQNIITEFSTNDVFLSLNDIDRLYRKEKYGEMTSADNLVLVLKKLNKQFNDDSKVRDTDRSLFFSGLMIA